MKALKIIFFFPVILIFTFCISQAQENNNGKITGTYSWPMQQLECVGEEVSGDLMGEFTVFKSGKIQEKWSGHFVGLTSGDTYSINMVKNQIWKDWITGTGWTNNYTWTLTIYNDTQGTVVGVVHYTTHMTINAKGTVTADFTNEKYECY